MGGVKLQAKPGNIIRAFMPTSWVRNSWTQSGNGVDYKKNG
jgi:hypothetical protein